MRYLDLFYFSNQNANLVVALLVNDDLQPRHDQFLEYGSLYCKIEK